MSIPLPSLPLFPPTSSDSSSSSSSSFSISSFSPFSSSSLPSCSLSLEDSIWFSRGFFEGGGVRFVFVEHDILPPTKVYIYIYIKE